MPPTQEEATALNNVNVQPEVNTDRLVAGASETILPDITREEFPTSNMNRASAVANETQSFIQSESENAKKLAERQQDLSDIAPDGELGDLFRKTQQSFGVNDNTLGELKDIQLQLADIDTGSKLTETRIAGGAGQTIGQAQREITQEQRENAVRTSGLAARAAVIQGNINTARQLALDAVNVAYKDRELKNQNLTQQIDILQGQVDAETAQLLQQERDKREDDQATVKELKTNIANAMVSGASQEEIRQLNDPLLDDAQKLALAQSIVARGANEERNLNLKILRDKATGSDGKLSTSVIDRGNGQKQLINTQTGEVIATYGEGELEGVEPFTPEQELAETNNINNIAGLATHPGFNSSVGPNPLARVAVSDLGGNKQDFIGSVENMLSVLTLNTFADAKARGMTFGAMSQGEWDILAASASKISKWRKFEDNDTTKSVVGYAIDESNFKSELDKLTQFSKLGFINKGGDPASVNVVVTDDGKYWSENSDGTVTQIR